MVHMVAFAEGASATAVKAPWEPAVTPAPESASTLQMRPAFGAQAPSRWVISAGNVNPVVVEDLSAQ